MKNIFRFKKFSIIQNPEVFKVGTDGVLAGCFSQISQAKTILDIGTGTGLLALICAQRNTKAKIIAIDSEITACKLAESNFQNSDFSAQFTVVCTELQNFNSKQRFDYIICNPPYFKPSQQLHQTHPVARHQLKLNYSVLLEKSKQFLSEGGIIGYIFPFEDEQDIIKQAEFKGLFPVRMIRISGIKNGKVKRTFLELSAERKETETIYFYVEESPRKWSEAYKELTKDFYL